MNDIEILINDNNKINFAPDNILDEVIQNVITICSTPKFSVTLDREFGVEAVFIDEAVNLSKNKYASEIIKAVRKFEPRAKIKSINFIGDLEGKIYPKIRININGY